MRKPKRKRKKKHSYTSEQVAQLIPLIEEWTRYEIAARLLPLQTNLCIDYYRRMLEKENEIRFLLYGSDDLPTLARLLGMDKSEDDVEPRPERNNPDIPNDSPFRPDEGRARARRRRQNKLRPLSQVKSASRVGDAIVDVDVDVDIEAILIAAGV